MPRITRTAIAAQRPVRECFALLEVEVFEEDDLVVVFVAGFLAVDFLGMAVLIRIATFYV